MLLFLLCSSKRCITVMVLIKLAFLAHLSSHYWLVPSSSLVHTQSSNNISVGLFLPLIYSIQVGNEFLIIPGTFCGIGSWVYFLKQYYDTSYWVPLQGTKLILGYSSRESCNLSLTHKLPELVLRSGTCYTICK